MGKLNYLDVKSGITESDFDKDDFCDAVFRELYKTGLPFDDMRGRVFFETNFWDSCLDVKCTLYWLFYGCDFSSSNKLVNALNSIKKLLMKKFNTDYVTYNYSIEKNPMADNGSIYSIEFTFNFSYT